jgi:hypothetical protein
MICMVTAVQAYSSYEALHTDIDRLLMYRLPVVLIV